MEPVGTCVLFGEQVELKSRQVIRWGNTARTKLQSCKDEAFAVELSRMIKRLGMLEQAIKLYFRLPRRSRLPPSRSWSLVKAPVCDILGL